jgi:hypothetical protein
VKHGEEARQEAASDQGRVLAVKLFKKDRDSSALVSGAQAALQAYWGTSGDQGRGEAAEACRLLTKEELRLVEAWIPQGSGLTAAKCDRARAIVRGVIAEK